MSLFRCRRQCALILNLASVCQWCGRKTGRSFTARKRTSAAQATFQKTRMERDASAKSDQKMRMKTIQSIVESLALMSVMRMKVYKLTDLRKYLLGDVQSECYVDERGTMLTPPYITESGIYELMPYDFMVDVVGAAAAANRGSEPVGEGYWGEVRRICHKTISREEPFVRRTDMVEWTDLLLTSSEIKDTVGRAFGEPFDSCNVYFEAYLNL